MNKKQINKLELFAQSLKNQYEEAGDFFIQLEINLVSGKKTFSANFVEQLYYNKEYYALDFNGAIDFIIKEAANMMVSPWPIGSEGRKSSFGQTKKM